MLVFYGIFSIFYHLNNEKFMLFQMSQPIESSWGSKQKNANYQYKLLEYSYTAIYNPIEDRIADFQQIF